MTNRSKTALILGITSAIMVSPLVMSIFWGPIPLFQNLGFDKESIASPIALDTRHDHSHRLCFIHNESDPFRFIEAERNLVVKTPWDSRSAGRWHCRRSLFSTMAYGYAHVWRCNPYPPGYHFRRRFWLSSHQLDTCQRRFQVYDSCNSLNNRFRYSPGYYLSRGRS